MATTVLLVVTARVPEAGVGWRLAFVGVHLAGSAASAWYVWRRPMSTGVMLVGALAFRLCALPMLPTLSDDGYRYLWDGWVTTEIGASPYQWRPSDPALADGHDRAEYQQMNSRDYYSVYPPASQLAFAAAVWTAPGDDWRSAWWVWKLLMVAAELGAVVLLMRVVPPAASALYAWSPIAVIEVSGQGHTEALMLVGLGAALTASRGRWPTASLGLVLAGAVKLYPLALLPVAWRREGWRGVVASVLAFVALGSAFASPDALAHVGESLGLFFGTFDEYAAPYRILKAAMYPLIGLGAGRGASVSLGVLFVVGVALALATDDGTSQRGQWTVIAVCVGFTLAASTLHPWYWLAILFLCPLLKYKMTIVWIVALANAGYLTYVVPDLELLVLVTGWGGGLVIGWRGWRKARERPLRAPEPTSL